MKRKFGFSMVFALAATLLLAPVTANAAVSDWTEPHEAVLTEEEVAALSAEERDAYNATLIRALGYVPTEEELANFADYVMVASSTNGLDGASHKAKYDPRTQSLGYKLPAIRDQGNYGTCWAHAATACVEIDLIKNHKASNSINLSELQLANSAYFHVGKDPIGYLGSDTYSISGFDKEIGGNDTLAANALSMRVGLVDENKVKEMAYSNMSKYSFKKLGSAYAYKNQTGVLDNFYTMKNPTMDDIKSAIEKYGAVKVSYYHSFYSSSNGKNGAYNNPSGYYGTNHAVTIVGWDDNYSKDNFNTKPNKNGAWIIRNSWGTGVLDKGYMYMSYEEPTAAIFSVYDANLAANDYKNLYQVESMPFGNYANSSSLTVANIFTAKNAEKIGAVQVRGKYVKGNKYTVKVYTGVSAGQPESGKLAATKTGTFSASSDDAVFFVDLGKTVSVAKGQRFSVVVNMGTSGSVFYEVKATVNFGSFLMTQSPEQKAGVSYARYNSGTQYSETGVNLGIKALAGKSASSSSGLGSFKVSSAAGNDKGVVLKWTKSKNAKGYKIYRDNKVIKTINSASTVSFVDTAAKKNEGKIYTYKVVAFSGKTTKAATAVKATYLKPTKISKATNSSKSVVTVTCSKSAKATGYQVSYSYNKNFSGAKSVNSKSTSIKIIKLKKGKTVYVKVRPYKTASKKNYYGPWSSVKAVKISE